jgi:hypothetical protein
MNDICLNGTCIACAQGLTACNSDCVDLQTHPSNCGHCGTVCPMGTSCVMGICK